MHLHELIRGIEPDHSWAAPDIEVTGVAYDSRRVQKGNIFVAIRGERVDGNGFVPQALANGAAAILSDRPRPEGIAVPWIQVRSTRRVLATLSARLHGWPSTRLNLVGITGTNGKTSTAFLLESILRADGKRTGLITTIEYRSPTGARTASRTTPESLDLQEQLRDFVDQGCAYAVMEVSSHALAMHRVEGCRFRSAVFTNLTPDHLDFHRTMDAYFEAKKRLFVDTGWGPPRRSLINLDDPRGPELAELCRGRCQTYSVRSPADFMIRRFERSQTGIEMTIGTPTGDLPISSKLLGRPNLSNVVAAVAASHDLGVELRVIQYGIENCRPIPGRFERIDQGQPFLVVVDYAHTQDALQKLLETVRELEPKRVLVLFGCGGDRDRTKRALMGKVAQHLSDYCVLTSDNPRNEDPLAIIRDIESGFTGGSPRYLVQPDRRLAIQCILREARPADAVIVAGKGHETYQELAGQILHFDDREEVRKALAELGWSKPSTQTGS
ncbi:MAG: UDP-N-acetylmuramoyl-L-alanyl-D-glutamate--2,6-diaminopimelate ligase [Acidobacteriota bacterium]